MSNHKNFSESRIFLLGKSLFRRILITIQFFDKNGLRNHAAGSAYGFLLAAAPTLLLVSILLLTTFRSSPHAISGLIQRDIPFLKIIFDENWMAENIIRISRSGVAGIFSVISLIWAGRLFALSMLQGLKIIFTGSKKQNPVKENLLIFLIQFVVVVFAVGLIISSQTALYIYQNVKFLPQIRIDIFSMFRSYLFPFAALGLITYCAYRIIPANPPRRVSALQGALLCAIPFGATSLILQFIISKTRYNFLYGTLGDLIILLVSVYFFFVFFFVGAQFAKVIDSLDVLLFSNLLKARKDSAENRSGSRGLWQNLFILPDGVLKKYLRHYKEGKIIFNKGDSSDDVYYLLEGTAEVLFSDSEESDAPSSILEAGVFFGEMGYLLSEKRNATVKAKTAISALVLPARLFDEALNYDTGIDRTVIQNLTERLKGANERMP